MSDKGPLTHREAMEQERARLLEEAAAIERDLAELDRLAAKYNLVVSAPGSKAPDHQAATQAAAEAPPAAQASERQGSDRSLGGLVACYRADERSAYHQVRFRTRENYEALLRRILKDAGDKKLSDLKAKEIQHLYDGWTEAGKLAMAHSLVTMLRGLITFGMVVLEDSECERLSVILHNMRFKVERERGEAMTEEHALAVIRKAHEMGFSSIALAQAFQFDCALKQKDVIGEWVPHSEPGVSDVTHKKGRKWLRGLRWSEIDKNLVLRHVTSMGGKLVEHKLSKAPLVLAELHRLGTLPQSGPIVVHEFTRLPYLTHTFRMVWRKVATAAGVPDSVCNMDSRARPATNEASEPHVVESGFERAKSDEQKDLDLERAKLH